MSRSPLVQRDGQWRQTWRGNCIWPRTFRGNDGLRHAALLSFDGGETGPVSVCGYGRAHRTGMDDRLRPVTCLVCLDYDPMFDYDTDARMNDAVDET